MGSLTGDALNSGNENDLEVLQEEQEPQNDVDKIDISFWTDIVRVPVSHGKIAMLRDSVSFPSCAHLH